MLEYIEEFASQLESKERVISRFLKGLELEPGESLVFDKGFEGSYMYKGPGLVQEWGETWYLEGSVFDYRPTENGPYLSDAEKLPISAAVRDFINSFIFEHGEDCFMVIYNDGHENKLKVEYY